MRIHFGYQRKGGRYVPNKFARVVREIFAIQVEQRMLHKTNASEIARQFNERKIPSPGGKEWHAKTVLQILRNPIYFGDDPEYDKLVERRNSNRPMVNLRKLAGRIRALPPALRDGFAERFDELEEVAWVLECEVLNAACFP